MKFSLDTGTTKYLISRYSAEYITINNIDYKNSLIVSPEHLIEHWRPQKLNELQNEDFEPIIMLKPKILILGVGEQHQFPEIKLLQAVYAHSIGIEIMTTPAACRTFNLLASEGRNVVAALLQG